MAAKKPAPENPLKAAALEYAAERGWRVFPLLPMIDGICTCSEGSMCTRPGKHPAIKAWEKNASTDSDKISEWWNKWPKAGIGIATGKESDLTVFDVDVGDASGDVTLNKLRGKEAMPDTPCVETGSGGRHYYFKFTPAVRTVASKIGAGLDTRSNGGYVVAPPSLHASGAKYKWLGRRDVELAQFPQWLLVLEEKRPPGRPRKEARHNFNATNPRDVARLRYALSFVDASDYDRWTQAGFAFGRAFDFSEEGWKVFNDWAKTASNYSEKESRQRYHHKGECKNPITIASIFEWAKENPAYDPSRGDDHFSLAESLLEKMETQSGARPVFTQGQFWTVDNGLWTPLSVDEVACRTGEWFRTEKFCKRNSDFKGIAQLAAQIVTDERFFDTAAVGIAGPQFLWTVEDGKLKHCKLTPAHRMRSRVNAEPDFKAKAPLFTKLLDYAFKNDHEQKELLQILFGLVLVQRLYKYQVAVLLYGRTGTGKSVLLTILRSMFLPELVLRSNKHFT